MIIIFPIDLDGVDFLLRHEQVFQIPNVPAYIFIFYFCQFTFKATRRPPYSHCSNRWCGQDHYIEGGWGGRKPQTGIIYIYMIFKIYESIYLYLLIIYIKDFNLNIKIINKDKNIKNLI